MRLSTYIQRTRALGDAKVPAHTIDQLAERIAGGADFAAILKKRSAALTPRLLLGIWRGWRRHQGHQAYLDGVALRRREGGESPIAPSLLKQTLAPHEVAVLERAEEMAPPGRGAEHRRRDAIKEAVALWNVSLSLTRREGKLTITAAEGADEAVAALAGEHTLAGLDAPTWRAVRRHERAGTLTLDLEAPVEQLEAQVSSRGAELSALTSGRTVEVFLDALIKPDLAEWAMRLKDEEAVILTTRDACNVYFELLTAPRPPETLYAGVWVEEPGGVAVVSRDGRLVHADAAEATVSAVEAVLGGHAVEAIVLPVGESEVLTTLREGFATLPQHGGLSMAIEDGADEDTEGLVDGARRALQMTRRAVRPLKFWGQVDPTRLALVPHQDELDEAPLRDALSDMRTLALAGIKPPDLAKTAPSRSKSARAAAKPLNPMIKTVDDLRPGLTVNGLVTNITQFGAFVNIGLSHEGLVHVSELADHFVNDPKEVVSVGQAVEARVLGVDRGRRRISLSLRPDRAAPGAGGRPGEDGQGGPPRDADGRVRLDDIPGTRGERRRNIASDRGRQNATGHSRVQALADLEALFKKK